MTIDNDTPSQPPLTAIVESLLFVADRPVSVKNLAEAIQCDARDVEATLELLAQEYQCRGVRLQYQKDRVQLVTAPGVAPCVERFLGLSLSGSLSTAALETLSIIAYKQPVTRAEIEAIRGVNSDGVLRTLMSKGLIEELGRLTTVGHPIVYGTTFEFLQYFGLSSLDELPMLEMERGETQLAQVEVDQTSDGPGTCPESAGG